MTSLGSLFSSSNRLIHFTCLYLFIGRFIYMGMVNGKFDQDQAGESLKGEREGYIIVYITDDTTIQCPASDG